MAEVTLQRVLLRITQELDLDEVGAPYMTLRTSAQHKGAQTRVGAVRVWVPPRELESGSAAAYGLEKLVYLQLSARPVSAHWLFAFSSSDSLVPHFAFGLTGSTQDATVSVHCDLLSKIPRSSACAAYTALCYEPLAETHRAVAAALGDRVVLNDDHTELSSERLLCVRAADESGIPPLQNAVGAYLNHWLSLHGTGGALRMGPSYDYRIGSAADGGAGGGSKLGTGTEEAMSGGRSSIASRSSSIPLTSRSSSIPLSSRPSRHASTRSSAAGSSGPTLPARGARTASEATAGPRRAVDELFDGSVELLESLDYSLRTRLFSSSSDPMWAFLEQLIGRPPTAALRDLLCNAYDLVGAEMLGDGAGLSPSRRDTEVLDRSSSILSRSASSFPSRSASSFLSRVDEAGGTRDSSYRARDESFMSDVSAGSSLRPGELSPTKSFLASGRASRLMPQDTHLIEAKLRQASISGRLDLSSSGNLVSCAVLQHISSISSSISSSRSSSSSSPASAPAPAPAKSPAASLRRSSQPSTRPDIGPLRELCLSHDSLPLDASFTLADPTFASLTSLSLFNNQLPKMPRGLQSLSSLTSLSLDYNNLTELNCRPSPYCREGLLVLKQLKSLGLYHNRLGRICDGIGEMSTLESLALQHNRITAIPGSFSKLHSLTQLHLTHNRLASASWLSGLSGLTSLGLSHNVLTTLPDDLSGLTRLKSVAVSHNRLESLPASLLGLPSLVTLVANANRISPTIPPPAPDSPLAELALDANMISDLPHAFAALSSLCWLSLGGNPLPEPLLAAASSSSLRPALRNHSRYELSAAADASHLAIIITTTPQAPRRELAAALSPALLPEPSVSSRTDGSTMAHRPSSASSSTSSERVNSTSERLAALSERSDAASSEPSFSQGPRLPLEFPRPESKPATSKDAWPPLDTSLASGAKSAKIDSSPTIGRAALGKASSSPELWARGAEGSARSEEGSGEALPPTTSGVANFTTAPLSVNRRDIAPRSERSSLRRASGMMSSGKLGSGRDLLSSSSKLGSGKLGSGKLASGKHDRASGKLGSSGKLDVSGKGSSKLDTSDKPPLSSDLSSPSGSEKEGGFKEGGRGGVEAAVSAPARPLSLHAWTLPLGRHARSLSSLVAAGIDGGQSVCVLHASFRDGAVEQWVELRLAELALAAEQTLSFSPSRYAAQEGDAAASDYASPRGQNYEVVGGLREPRRPPCRPVIVLLSHLDHLKASGLAARSLTQLRERWSALYPRLKLKVIALEKSPFSGGLSRGCTEAAQQALYEALIGLLLDMPPVPRAAFELQRVFDSGGRRGCEQPAVMLRWEELWSLASTELALIRGQDDALLFSALGCLERTGRIVCIPPRPTADNPPSWVVHEPDVLLRQVERLARAAGFGTGVYRAESAAEDEAEEEECSVEAALLERPMLPQAFDDSRMPTGVPGVLKEATVLNLLDPGIEREREGLEALASLGVVLQLRSPKESARAGGGSMRASRSIRRSSRADSGRSLRLSGSEERRSSMASARAAIAASERELGLEPRNRPGFSHALDAEMEVVMEEEEGKAKAKEGKEKGEGEGEADASGPRDDDGSAGGDGSVEADDEDEGETSDEDEPEGDVTLFDGTGLDGGRGTEERSRQLAPHHEGELWALTPLLQDRSRLGFDIAPPPDALKPPALKAMLLSTSRPDQPHQKEDDGAGQIGSVRITHRAVMSEGPISRYALYTIEVLMRGAPSGLKSTPKDPNELSPKTRSGRRSPFSGGGSAGMPTGLPMSPRRGRSNSENSVTSVDSTDSSLPESSVGGGELTASHIVRRRYRDFKALHAALVAQHGKAAVPELPPSEQGFSFRRITDEAILRRATLLHAFLQELVANPSLRAGGALDRFLETAGRVVRRPAAGGVPDALFHAVQTWLPQRLPLGSNIQLGRRSLSCSSPRFSLHMMLHTGGVYDGASLGLPRSALPKGADAAGGLKSLRPHCPPGMLIVAYASDPSPWLDDLFSLVLEAQGKYFPSLRLRPVDVPTAELFPPPDACSPSDSTSPPSTPMADPPPAPPLEGAALVSLPPLPPPLETPL